MRKYSLSLLTGTLLVLLAISLSACSGGKSPIAPMIKDSNSSALPDSSVNSPVNRDVIAIYDATIDPDAGTFTITPCVREGSYHYPLTQLYPNVLKITGYGWTPNFWADIKLKHPFPEGGISGFDPRVIAILPANLSVRFIYPVLGVGGNNSVVLEPDGYTKLFDSLGGSIPGNVNPFKAYFKEQPYRVWSGTGVTEETQRWQMKLSGFGGPMQYKLVVDVSTKYPKPPQPVDDNAPEPIQIDATVGSGLTTAGGSATVTVTLIDWQGQSGIGGVQIESPDLFNGTLNLTYSAPGPNPNEYIYTSTITNSLLAPEGEHKILVASWDQTTGIYMYNEFAVEVGHIISEGNLFWAKRAGGSGGGAGLTPEGGYGATTLSDNSTVISGVFSGSATFGPDEPNQTVLTSVGDTDIFIARYNPDGTLAWAKRAGMASDDEGLKLTTLSADSIVVTGGFIGSSTFGPSEPNQTVLTSAGWDDIFIARYNPDGTLVWAKRAGGSSDDEGYGITTLSDNSTVVSGWFRSTITFGPGEPNQTVLISDGLSDMFIARYNPDGTLVWAKRAGGSSWDGGYGITALSDNSIVVSGVFEGTATFGPSEPNQTVLTSTGWGDLFVARYNPDGTILWAKCAGAPGSNYDRSNEITALSDNSVVVTGLFGRPDGGTATFGSGEPNETVLTSAGGSDIFIARYNPNGILAWAKCAGGPLDQDYGVGITTLSDNSTVVSGYFRGTATFGPGEANQTILTSSAWTDTFIACYHLDGTLSWAKHAGGSIGNGFNIELDSGITTLSDNSIVVTGNFIESATFGYGEPNETILTSAGSYDIFIARFKP